MRKSTPSGSPWTLMTTTEGIFWLPTQKKENLPPIDTSGKLPSGDKFEDFQGLKGLLLTKKREQVVRNLTSQLLSYALCRKLGRGDQPVVEDIASRAVLKNSTWKELLIEVANSAPFRESVF